MGPYAATASGNRYILLAVERTSRWIECVPSKHCDTRSMAKFYCDKVVSNWGVPRTITTDGGKEFGADFSKLVTDMGTQHLHSAAYKPTTNGMAEAAVKSVLHSLQATVSTSPENWDECLWTVIMGLRNSTHSSTSYSPHYVMTGRHAVTVTERKRLQAATSLQQLERLDAPAEQDDLPPLQAVGRAHEFPHNLQQQTNSGLASHSDRFLATNNVEDPTMTVELPPGLTTAKPTPPGHLAATAAASTFPSSQQHRSTAQTAGTHNQLPTSRKDTPLIVISSDSEGPPTGDGNTDGTGLDPATQAHMLQRETGATDLAMKLEENVLAAQAEQMRDFAKRHHSTELDKVMPEGSFVLMRCPASTKLHKGKSVEGPYLLNKWSPGFARAQLQDKLGRKWEVSATRLTPWSHAATQTTNKTL